MFNVYFSATEFKSITRKSNAVKVAERDGALFVLDAAGTVVWGEKPAAPTEKAKREMRAYRLDGHIAAADREKAEALSAVGSISDGYEMVAAEEVEEGDTILGGRVRRPHDVVASMKVGTKWVTFYDANDKVFGYYPLGTLVPRLIEN